VVTALVAADGMDGATFVGSVQPRYSTELAFRTGGRIVHRAVSVGDAVRRGDEIATLDRRSLQLTVETSAANLETLRARAKNAHDSLGRATKMFASSSTTQAALDDARLTALVADASVEEAEARLARAKDEASYGTLRAESDGVITRVDFEVEQTVAPNVPVAELARTDVLDDVFDVPEAVAQGLAVGDPFVVHPSSPTSTGEHAKIRLISPSADPSTRTRRVWASLEARPSPLRIGTTTYAERAVKGRAELRVPVGALVEHADGVDVGVWVVDHEAVVLHPVTLRTRDEGRAIVASGLQLGDRVVTRGVHSLHQGERVKVDEEGEVR
jgi:RND family efflux transporter MFP subunit